ncbi:DUF6318 family protein [Actinomyces sp. MRS3W]|uniref:DUF6318 family protein n=1 Tax=Actinomyces sp. MRS3W TaxID=2800796 RepID=UPI0028FD63C7|nr:DUF6318 family protein [Actinomyces sp. MRS3W]MDU0349186.1 DUF6318 family protein [Actinomyces sp. MRS3W]
MLTFPSLTSLVTAPQRRSRLPHRPSHGRHPNRAARAAVLAACLTLLAAGCSGNGNTTDTPTGTAGGTPAVSASPTPSASQTPSPSPTLNLSPEDTALRETALAMEEPQPYEGADEHSDHGAILTAGHFIELYPYVYATGDLTTWQNMSDDNCEFCNSVINNATELHGSGGWIDPWNQELTILEYWTDDSDPNRYVIRLNVISDPHTSHSGDGRSTTQAEASDDTLLVQLHWSDEAWSVEVVDIENGGEPNDEG